MVYPKQFQGPEFIKTSSTNCRVSFKNTCETANALRGKTVTGATTYLKRVLAHKDCVPIRKFTGGTSHPGSAKQHKGTAMGKFPTKSCNYLLDLLKNLEGNAKFSEKDVENLKIVYINVNRARVRSRRTFRAHGRVNPYNSQPCHIHIVCQQAAPQSVPKAVKPQE